MIFASGSSKPAVWTTVAGGIYIVYLFWSSVRAEEQKRVDEGRPHKITDTWLLLFSGLSIAAVLLCGLFFKSVFVSSHVGFYAVLIVLGGGLTYIFNRKRPRGSH